MISSISRQVTHVWTGDYLGGKLEIYSDKVNTQVYYFNLDTAECALNGAATLQAPLTNEQDSHTAVQELLEAIEQLYKKKLMEIKQNVTTH